jgi:hypothetical protein
MDILTGFINLLVVVIALVIVYYSFGFFYGTSTSNGVTVESGKISANQGVKKYVKPAQIYEGGEYSVNFWVYVSGWTYKQGTRKHVLEVGGTNFATLLVALGSTKNSLSVRVDTRDASGSSVNGIGLTNADKELFFKPLQSDGALTVQPMCDIDEIDMQRWIQVTVCINGRTCDVYMDGKLARSCVLPSFYKVDPTGQSVTLVDRGGFDGYVSRVSTYNYSLNPSAVYGMYQAGPTGASLDPWAYFSGLFKTQQ